MAHFRSRRDLSLLLRRTYRVWGSKTGHGRAGGLPEEKPIQQVFPGGLLCGGLLCARHKEQGFQKPCLEGEWRGKKDGFCRAN